MADHNVIINADGTCKPPSFGAFWGDTVAFHATVDAVLCVSPGTVFGAGKFVIPEGRTLQLVVQSFAPVGHFTCTVDYGDLMGDCPGATGTGGDIPPE